MIGRETSLTRRSTSSWSKICLSRAGWTAIAHFNFSLQKRLRTSNLQDRQTIATRYYFASLYCTSNRMAIWLRRAIIIGNPLGNRQPSRVLLSQLQIIRLSSQVAHCSCARQDETDLTHQVGCYFFRRQPLAHSCSQQGPEEQARPWTSSWTRSIPVWSSHAAEPPFIPVVAVTKILQLSPNWRVDECHLNYCTYNYGKKIVGKHFYIFSVAHQFSGGACKTQADSSDADQVEEFDLLRWRSAGEDPSLDWKFVIFGNYFLTQISDDWESHGAFQSLRMRSRVA